MTTYAEGVSASGACGVADGEEADAAAFWVVSIREGARPS